MRVWKDLETDGRCLEKVWVTLNPEPFRRAYRQQRFGIFLCRTRGLEQETGLGIACFGAMSPKDCCGFCAIMPWFCLGSVADPRRLGRWRTTCRTHFKASTDCQSEIICREMDVGDMKFSGKMTALRHTPHFDKARNF